MTITIERDLRFGPLTAVLPRGQRVTYRGSFFDLRATRNAELDRLGESVHSIMHTVESS